MRRFYGFRMFLVAIAMLVFTFDVNPISRQSILLQQCNAQGYGGGGYGGGGYRGGCYGGGYGGYRGSSYNSYRGSGYAPVNQTRGYNGSYRNGAYNQSSYRSQPYSQGRAYNGNYSQPATRNCMQVTPVYGYANSPAGNASVYYPSKNYSPTNNGPVYAGVPGQNPGVKSNPGNVVNSNSYSASKPALSSYPNSTYPNAATYSQSAINNAASPSSSTDAVKGDATQYPSTQASSMQSVQQASATSSTAAYANSGYQSGYYSGSTTSNAAAASTDKYPGISGSYPASAQNPKADGNGYPAISTSNSRPTIGYNGDGEQTYPYPNYRNNKKYETNDDRSVQKYDSRNINNFWFFANQPFWFGVTFNGLGWDAGLRTGWGIGPGFVDVGFAPIWANTWHQAWQLNAINPRFRSWYHGCWTGYWDAAWYSPIRWGASPWGLNAFSTSAFANQVYRNPYFTPLVASFLAVNYSAPILLENQRVEGSASASKALSEGVASFDRGRASFKKANYRESLLHFQAAIQSLPNDPLVNEVLALNYFALGNYDRAAAILNALLPSAPGMDWKTMSGLYSNVDEYVVHRQALEKYSAKNKEDAGARFVLAYHYLVTGAREAAISSLKEVVTINPIDLTSQRMLEGLTQQNSKNESNVTGKKAASTNKAGSAVALSAEPKTAASDEEVETPSINRGIQIDWLGKWKAEAEGSKLELSLDEASNFIWTIQSRDSQGLQIQGRLTADDLFLQFTSSEKGTLAGYAVVVNADKWVFMPPQSSEQSQGITFERIR